MAGLVDISNVQMGGGFAKAWPGGPAVFFDGANVVVEADLAHRPSGGKVGFFGTAPIVQRTAYTQTYSTADKTHANMTSADVATTAVTQTTPYGYATAAQGDAVAVAINAIRADVIDLKQVVNSVIDDLQAYGLVG